MKLRIFYFALFIALPLFCSAQTAESSFHLASNQYIHEKNREAINTLESALKKYPNDAKLRALREKIKEDQKKEQQKKEQEQKQKEQQEKEQKEKEQKEKEQKEKEQQEKEEQQKKEEQEKKQPQEKESKEKEQEKKEQPNLDEKKLEEMKISEEKARMLLEAMKNQEKQYLQQNKRKATKSKDHSKPDW